MWGVYQSILQQYPKISLSEERCLIRRAQKGCVESEKEVVLRRISFLIFRLRRRLFREYLQRFGEDFLEESILLLYQKVKTYNLRYRDKHGNLRPIKFVSYIWKRVDGFIIDSANEETEKERLMKSKNVEDFSHDQPCNDTKATGEMDW